MSKALTGETKVMIDVLVVEDAIKELPQLDLKVTLKRNLVFCTHKVNTIKCDLTLNELKMWIPKWYNKIIKRRRL